MLYDRRDSLNTWSIFIIPCLVITAGDFLWFVLKLWQTQALQLSYSKSVGNRSFMSTVLPCYALIYAWTMVCSIWNDHAAQTLCTLKRAYKKFWYWLTSEINSAILTYNLDGQFDMAAYESNRSKSRIVRKSQEKIMQSRNCMAVMYMGMMMWEDMNPAFRLHAVVQWWLMITRVITGRAESPAFYILEVKHW